MKPGRKNLALFDLDHTLLPLDSDHAWGAFTTRIGWTDAQEFARRNAEFFAHYQNGTLDIREYVAFAAQAFCQRGAEQAHAARARFMREVIEPAILPAARALLQQHRAQGDTLLIVTATNEFITRPIAQALGVAHLIAVELQRDAHGWYTPQIAGIPSMREGKVQRVEQWLHARGLDWGGVYTTFYSDSRNDLPLLECVNRPVATNPDAHLRAAAAQRGWRILDLFDHSE